ncbi:DUF397 domain-containing protein [Umezawaea sp. Da 62-37]|uniref:DUF397 domain-containing protein n=1 Tax=Umezawaea sp. Da 62-37 TaxID=3075927 RepID=UPI0028F6DDFF|nr:DUF397 domain-containing protein [Umezawaea sp. Da 62-37]WNV83392.1 DUF397 domain-containing protein [Umezawaea sp. Da 62-37]
MPRTWRKSSRSGGIADSDCVEVSFARDVAVRDSKNAAGPVLAFAPARWRAFVRHVSR